MRTKSIAELLLCSSPEEKLQLLMWMHRYMQRQLAQLELEKLAYYEQGNHQAWELEHTEVKEAIAAVLAALDQHFPFPESLRISI